MTAERTGELSQRSIFEPTQRFVTGIFDCRENRAMGEFKLMAFTQDPDRDLVVFKIGEYEPVAVEIKPDGRMRQKFLDPESPYYRAVTQKETPLDPAKVAEVNDALRIINNQGISMKKDGCASDAGFSLYNNVDTLKKMKVPGYVAGPSDIPAEAVSEDKKGQNQQIIFKDVVVVSTNRREGPIAIFNGYTQKEWDEIRQEGLAKLEEKQKAEAGKNNHKKVNHKNGKKHIGKH